MQEMGRLSFSFVGTSEHPMSIDPAEYRGMKVPAITATLLNTLRSIAPGVDFFEQDVEMAAIAVAEANER